MEHSHKYKDLVAEALVKNGNFEEAKKHAKKGILVLSCIASLLVAGLIILGTYFDEVKNSLAYLGGFVALFMYYIYSYCSDLRAIKKEEKAYQAKMQAIIEAESPDNLYAQLCKVLNKQKAIGGKCIITRIEEGVCVDELTELYLKEKEIGEKEGFTPVILQLDNNLIENIEMNMDADMSADVSFEEVFTQAESDLKGIFVGEPGTWEDFIGTDDDTEGECLDGIDGVDFLWGRFVMVRVPVVNPYDVFTYIPFGDWNDCPKASSHRAFAKHWYEHHGAVPCVISSDRIMYYVSQPVGKAKAFNLAMEHAAYCPDTPMQITFTVWDLAKQLERSTFWFCWWD